MNFHKCELHTKMNFIESFIFVTDSIHLNLIQHLFSETRYGHVITANCVMYNSTTVTVLRLIYLSFTLKSIQFGLSDISGTAVRLI